MAGLDPDARVGEDLSMPAIAIAVGGWARPTGLQWTAAAAVFALGARATCALPGR